MLNRSTDMVAFPGRSRKTVCGTDLRDRLATLLEKTPRPRSSEGSTPSRASSSTMRQLAQGLAQETIGQFVCGRVPRSPVFAVHVHHAKRTALRIAKHHDRVTWGTRRNDGDLSIRCWVDLQTGWKQGVHSAQDASGIDQGKLRWFGVAFFHRLVRRCSKVLQRFLQVLLKQWRRGAPSVARARVECEEQASRKATVRYDLHVYRAAALAHRQRSRTSSRHDLGC